MLRDEHTFPSSVGVHFNLVGSWAGFEACFLIGFGFPHWLRHFPLWDRQNWSLAALLAVFHAYLYLTSDRVMEVEDLGKEVSDMLSKPHTWAGIVKLGLVAATFTSYDILAPSPEVMLGLHRVPPLSQGPLSTLLFPFPCILRLWFL